MLSAEAPASRLILLADDEPCVRVIVATILSRGGYRVLTAASGEAALQLARKLPAGPDLLLADVVMPGLSGPALAREIARLCPATRILLMAGSPDNPELHAAIQGGLGFLPKPFSSRTLLDQVALALAGSPVRGTAVAVPRALAMAAS